MPVYCSFILHNLYSISFFRVVFSIPTINGSSLKCGVNRRWIRLFCVGILCNLSFFLSLTNYYTVLRYFPQMESYSYKITLFFYSTNFFYGKVVLLRKQILQNLYLCNILVINCLICMIWFVFSTVGPIVFVSSLVCTINSCLEYVVQTHCFFYRVWRNRCYLRLWQQNQRFGELLFLCLPKKLAVFAFIYSPNRKGTVPIPIWSFRCLWVRTLFF